MIPGCNTGAWIRTWIRPYSSKEILLQKCFPSSTTTTRSPITYINTSTTRISLFHSQVTSKIPRLPYRAIAHLIRKHQETPSVTSYQFKIDSVFHDPDLNPAFISTPPSHNNSTASLITKFSFKPGQWVDFFLPPSISPIVGGFSITSTPEELTSSGIIELALKYSDRNPIVKHLHHSAQIGEKVQLRVGGQFVLEEHASSSKNYLFVAGGVGLTPLMSMISHLVTTSNATRNKVMLLHSCKRTQECLFWKRLSDFASLPNSALDVRYFITDADHGHHVSTHGDGYEHFYGNIHKRGRMDHEDLLNAVKELTTSDGGIPDIYVCGPSTMTQSVLKMLERGGVAESSVKYEKWW